MSLWNLDVMSEKQNHMPIRCIEALSGWAGTPFALGLSAMVEHGGNCHPHDGFDHERFSLDQEVQPMSDRKFEKSSRFL